MSLVTPVVTRAAVDGSSAGSGNLEILVNGGHVTSHVRDLGGQRFVASFVPHSAIQHTIEMTFNGDPVPGRGVGGTPLLNTP